MKKLLFLLAAVGMIFTACDSGLDNEENGGTPSTPKIELSQQSVEVEFESAGYEVTITSPYSWEATAKNDWIKVITENGIAGTKELKFSVERNEELEIREGTIVVKNEDYNLIAELYITQKAFVPAITIEPESLAFAVEGGTQEIAITANFKYEFSTTADWLTIEKSEKGVSVTVSNYVEVENRTAEITISNEKYGISKVVKATQGAFVPEWTIKPESLAFAVEGGTQEIAITANFEYEYSTNADWLTVEKSENGVKITAATHIETTERTADITISNEKYGISKIVNVTQGAFVPAITIEPESLAFAVEGGTQEIAITANFEYEYSTNADWLTIEKSEKGVNITATPNTKFEERTTEITISSEKYGISKAITIMQQGVSAEAQNIIIYTSSDGLVVKPYNTNVFGANIVSNTYENSKGVIIFDAPVTSIGSHAFIYCSSLTSVTIPDGVTSIGDYAFCECTSLTSVTIPNSVTCIGDYAFYNCSSLTAFYGKFASADNRCLIIDGVLNSFASAGLTEYTIPDSVTSIGERAFSGCSSLTSITIPDSVTSIGNWTFGYCRSLTSVTIPNSVTSIGGAAFYECSSLTSVTIPDSVTSIGNSAFYGCTSLKSVTIGKGVTSIGGRAFYNCTGELIINSKIVETDYTYNNYPANSNNGWLYGAKFTKVTIGNSVTSIGNYAFRVCESLTSVTIPDSVTSIGLGAFQVCESLTSVTIPNSVTSIGGFAFNSCSSLTRVNISDLSAWCKISFGNNSANPLCHGAKLYLSGSELTDITIPSDITEIKVCAFYCCTSLTNITIPDSVTLIGSSAFSGCTSLTSVYCKPTTPPTGNSNMFNNNASGRKIYVPRNSVEAYKSAEYWSDYASYIVGYDF